MMRDSSNPSAGVQPVHLEDLVVGQRFTSRTHVIDEAQIVAFAREFDPQFFHLDAQAATSGPFGRLVASGWHTASISMRLLVESAPAIAGGLVGAGTTLDWLRPTYPGDTLHVETEIVAVMPSRSRPDRGLVTIRSELRNQHGEAVTRSTAKLVVPRRPVAGRLDDGLEPSER